MARIETLQTLPEWFGQDEPVDGWACDTEPGIPAEATQEPASILVPLVDLLRAAQTVPPSAPFQEVASVIGRTDGDPVVVAEAGNPIGLVRPVDLARAFCGTDDPSGLSAAELMTVSIYCLRIEAPADRALELFTRRGAREVLVIDAFGSLLGLVMPEDLVRVLSRTKPPKSSA